MNINPTVITALTPIGLPVKPDIYKGAAVEYITFNYADERPALNADNTDQLDSTTIQVHLFTPNDPISYKKAIRKALRAADFSIISTQSFVETESDGTFTNHVVVEACIDGVVNDD